MDIVRKTLLESETVQIDRIEARPVSDACGGVERQGSNAIVLPVSGVFSRHDAPHRYVTGTPSHAVFIAADAPYRISFPGAIGDRALTLKFSHQVAADRLGYSGRSDGATSHGLLPAEAILLRNLLWTHLATAEIDHFEAEALGLDLLDLSLGAMHAATARLRPGAQVRRTRALERVKEAVAAAPARRWNVAKLADIASLSPFHLCHVFRLFTGASVHEYVVRERLAATLDAVLDGGEDLTAIALEAGFASHSHFTARFRRFFGCTPAALRRAASGRRVAELRKIMTARRTPLA
jgi:AraC-like DNA-binding protein